MSSHVARRRGSLPARRTLSLTFASIVLAAVVAAALTTPSAARADHLADVKAQAARLQTEVDRIEGQVADAQERLRSTQYRLAELNTQTADAAHQLRVARQSLGDARRQLTTHAVEVYRTGEMHPDLWWAVTNAGSIADISARVDAANRIGTQDTTITRRLTAAKIRVAAKHAALQQLQSRQQVLVRQAERESRAVNALYARKNAALSHANAEVRRIMEERRRAAAAAAAARARAEAAQHAAARAHTSATPAQTFSAPANLGGSGSGTAAAAVAAAESQLGTPYVWGGSSPGGFDCSGLVMWSYGQAGVSLPRTTYAMWNAGQHVSTSDMVPGDLIFMYGLGHVGMYVGGGTMIHAPHTGDVVRYAPVPGGVDGVVRVA